MQSMNWYFERLRAMSGQEVAFRVRNSLVAQVRRWQQYLPPAEPRRLTNSLNSWLPTAPELPAERYVSAARDLVAGRLLIFHHEADDYGESVNWNRDPCSRIVAPLAYAKTMDYRDSAIVGDIKYLWEPNRHLQFVTLAQAYRLSGDSVFLEALEMQAVSWFRQSPYLRGANWASALEVGIRLINWSIAWQLVLEVGSLADETRDQWQRSIYQHCKYISQNFSGYSSANNHLIGEAAGLFVAACTWPIWPESEQWRDSSLAILEEEARKQIAEDGVGLEQAISYQQFILDFFLLSGLAGRSMGVDFSAGLWERLELALDFVASVMDVGGNVPMIGDADDGYVVKLSQEPDFCPYRSLLATGSILFDRADFARKAGSLDEKTLWLLGPDATDKWTVGDTDADSDLPMQFTHGGYFQLGENIGRPDEVKLLIDAGTLGYESIAAHGHADALSICLSVAGDEVLIDPGTYSYHTKGEWRAYFRGTSAHNTVVVDREDQSTQGGNFLWTTHAGASVTRYNSEDGVFEGSHDGYMRLSDPVAHIRHVGYNRAAHRFTITDTLRASATHTVERWWHFSEQCRVEALNGYSVRIETDHAEIVMAAQPDSIEQSLYRGSLDPIAGWVSRRFDVKGETTSLVWKTTIDETEEFLTTIDIRLGNRA